MNGSKNNKGQRKIPILDQWVEVTVQDGRTITELFPPNEVLREEGRAMDPTPELVYRRIFFPSGVPPEYNWTFPDDMTRQYGGGCIQRLTLKTWLNLSAIEELFDDGHIRPSNAPYVPRPNERGGCECPACASNQHVLEQLGYST